MAVLPDAMMLKFKKEKYADHLTFTVTRNNEIRRLKSGSDIKPAGHMMDLPVPY